MKHFYIISKKDLAVYSADRRIKIEFEDLGEGISGEYNPDDKKDVPLLRFSIYKQNRHRGGWDPLPDTSYCTQMPVTTSKPILFRALIYILSRVREPIMAEESIKKLCEELSWIEPRQFHK